MEIAFGDLDVLAHAKRREILADQHHHGIAPELGAFRRPFRLHGFRPFLAVSLRQRLADGDEVVAGVEALGRRAGVLPQRFAVAIEHRPGKRLELGAGVVDVVLAGDREARLLQQRHQRVAEHRAAAVPDVQRSGGVGRDVLDIDRLAGAKPGIAIGGAGPQHLGEPRVPEPRGRSQVDEARPRRLGVGDRFVGADAPRQFLGDVARLALGRVGEHQGGVGRHLAMGRIARRLDRDRVQIGRFRQQAGPHHILYRIFNKISEITEIIH